MLFTQTRGNDNTKEYVTFSEAILSPSASFGGLYVPKELPDLGDEFYSKFQNSSYKELAFYILKKFEIDIDDATINEALSLYDNFDTKNPAKVEKINDKLFVNELYHGPTRAFKDMALQPFGYILSALAKKQNQKYLILAATSGDTGPAALDTFKNKPNIQVVCLYPDGGTSDVQRLQMVTNDAPNLQVLGIKGNFDDAQFALKNLLASQSFADELSKNDIKLSAANSVNFGRIIFQIIYHFWSYFELLRANEIVEDEKIYLVVPSGNFGNALGAYYAIKMGLPIEQILISSNSNNVLTQWIEDGIYDLRDKELIMTISPAMDILKSSNIERILFDMFGSSRTKELMDSLSQNNFFEHTDSEKKAIQKVFRASYSSDDRCKEIMKHCIDTNSYMMDPHTATCIDAYKLYAKESGLKTVIYSTAEWTKFSPTVLEALLGEKSTDFEALTKLSEAFDKPIHKNIKSIFDTNISHTTIIEKTDIEKEVLKFIKAN
jgi:threonine synthase